MSGATIIFVRVVCLSVQPLVCIKRAGEGSTFGIQWRSCAGLHQSTFKNAKQNTFSAQKAFHD